MIGFFLVIQLPELIEKWGKTKSEAANAAMKQQMIERGFSAEEIVQVLNAGSGASERPALPRVPASRE
jgi:SOS response regulatory protein OraA/RecX